MPPEPPPSPRKYSDGTLYRRLLDQARPYWLHLTGLFLLQLVATPIALLVPIPLQITVDSVIGGKPVPSWIAGLLPSGWERPDALLWVAAIAVVGVSLLLQIQEMLAWIYRTWIGERLVLDLRARLFRHLQSLSLTYHDTGGTAQSVYRVQSDASSIETVLVQGLVRIVTMVLRIVVLVFATWQIDAKLVLIALVASPVMFLLTRLFRGRLRAGWRLAKERETAAMSVVSETLAAVRVVKAFGQEEREKRRFQEEAQAGIDASVKAVSSHGGFDLLVGLTVGIVSAAVLYVGASQVLAGKLTLGQLLLVVGYLSQLFGPLREVGTKMADLQRALAGAERTFTLIDEKSEAEERPGAKPLDRAVGTVEFRGVAFAYGTNPPLFRDVSFSVAAGSRVGIAGRTGSGKTTLLSLLFRFYDPTAGSILLDGTDLRDWKLRDLRNQFSFVLQDAVLFSTTVAENIAYGRPSATPEEIVAAARAANAHDFIVAMPKGYDTEVGERGMRLSGGERQRIALARAFLKDAPLLILDEPTSALDVKTEAAIVDALDRLMKGRTTFMIAHRLGTLASCDVRLEVRDGQVLRREHDLHEVDLGPATVADAEAAEEGKGEGG